MGGDREAAVEMCHQMQLFRTGGEGRQRVWQLFHVHRGARLPVPTKVHGKFSAVQLFLFYCVHVGVELPVTVPVVQCMLTDMARSQVAADPPTIFFRFRYASHGKISHPLVGPGGAGFVAGYKLATRVEVRFKGH